MAGNTAILGVRITGNASGAVSALNETERGASKLGKAAKGLGKIVGGGALAAGGAAVAGIGVAISKGFTRLSGIDTASKKLTGLGHNAKSVDVIMGNALNSVEGTAFGLDEAATVAAGAVAAGIKPGQDLEKTLTTVANSASAAETSMGDMGSIFNKVATSNKAQNDVLKQVADQGIPIYQELGKVMGVTSDEVFELARKGKVDFATFEKAMTSASGNVAKELGNSVPGATANFNAALSRLGAGLLAGVFPQVVPLIQSATGVIDRLAAASAPAAEWLGNKLGGAMGVVAGWLDKLDFTSFDAFLSSSGISNAPAQFTSIGESVKALAPAFGEFLVVLPKLGPAFSTLAGAGLTLITGALGFLADNVDTLVALMPLIVGGFIAWRAASAGLAQAQLAVRAGEVAAAPILLANQLLRFANVRAEQQLALAKGQATAATIVNNGAENAGLLTRVRGTAALVAQRVAMVAATVATRAAAAGQWLLNAAMTANPIGLVVAALALLVGGIIWAWNNVDWFRNGIVTAWNWIKNASKATWAAVTTGLQKFGSFVLNINLKIAQFFITTWGKIKAFFYKWAVEVPARVILGLVILKQRGQAKLQEFVGTVKRKFDDAVNFVKSFPNKAKNALGNLGSLLKGSGRSLIDGFINGINGMIGKVTSAAKNVVSKVRDFFPFSPAKTGPFSGSGYTTHSGRALVDDFAAAMVGERAAVRKAANRVAGAGHLTGSFDLPVWNVQPLDLRRDASAPRETSRRSAEKNVTINFNSVVTDRLGVAREIKKILAEYDALVVGA
ncbi:hypothetical protein D3I60_01725 [Brevibacterium permense]|uniref:tape measure protein n=1 Tax=Brevibacterium permense TaxID=234834 RepID=UPI0021D3BAE4|nr:hypothetical protein [Brevibacterium permense]